MPQQLSTDQVQMLRDFSGLPEPEKQKVIASPKAPSMVRDFYGLPEGERLKVLGATSAPASTPDQDYEGEWNKMGFGGQVVSQAGHFLKGAAWMIPQTISSAPSLLKNAFTGNAMGMMKTVQDIAKPLTVPLQSAASAIAPNSVMPPSRVESEQAAEGGGALAAGLVLGAAAKGLASNPVVKGMFKSPGLDAPAVNNWMDVPAKEVAHGANPGARVLSEKLLADTKAATKANIDSALGKTGAQMESKLKAATASGATIDAQTPVYDATAKAVKRIGSPRDSAFQAQINGIVDDIEAKYPNLHQLTPEQAHALKVELGDAIKWRGASYDLPANQAMVQIYRDLNTAIKGAVPDIGDLQAKWGDLHIASKNLAEAMNEDVVGKGSGPGLPKPPDSPAMKAAKIGAKWALPAGGGLALGHEVYRTLRQP